MTAVRAPAIADDLARLGLSVRDAWLAPADVAALAAEAASLCAAGAFRPAGIGAGRSRVSAERGDEILWLDPATASPAQHDVLRRLEALRLELNRELALGAFELEIHFAAYPAGAVYRTHIDRLRGDDARVLSLVLYLNQGWDEPDGGALRLYLAESGREPFIEVPPRGGTLVAFLSDRFPHEVLPARRERLSLAGWFRRRAPDR